MASAGASSASGSTPNSSRAWATRCSRSEAPRVAETSASKRASRAASSVARSARVASFGRLDPGRGVSGPLRPPRRARRPSSSRAARFCFCRSRASVSSCASSAARDVMRASSSVASARRRSRVGAGLEQRVAGGFHRAAALGGDLGLGPAVRELVGGGLARRRAPRRGTAESMPIRWCAASSAPAWPPLLLLERPAPRVEAGGLVAAGRGAPRRACPVRGAGGPARTAAPRAARRRRCGRRAPRARARAGEAARLRAAGAPDSQLLDASVHALERAARLGEAAAEGLLLAPQREEARGLGRGAGDADDRARARPRGRA